MNPDEFDNHKIQILKDINYSIRTNLDVILGIVNLSYDTSLTKLQKDYISKLETSSYNLLELVNDISDYTKLSSNKIELASDNISLNKCIEDSIEILNLKDRVFLDSDENINDIIITDYYRLKQIIINLLSSLSKTQDKYPININISGNICEDDKFIETKICLKNKQASQYTYTPQEDNSSISVFVRDKLIKLFEGTLVIDITSLSTKYTFKFKTKYKSLDYKNILIMDSDKVSRLNIISSLNDLPVNCVPCSSDEEALIYLKNKNFHFDIILLDSNSSVYSDSTVNSNYSIYSKYSKYSDGIPFIFISPRDKTDTDEDLIKIINCLIK